MTRSWWGWGEAERALGDAEVRALGEVVAAELRTDARQVRPVPALDDVALPPVRVRPPAALAHLCSDAPPDRAGHTYGKAFRDVARALDGDLSAAPDLVAFPADEADVVAVLDWCGDAGVAVVPYGGGSSVVGGVECRARDDLPGVVSLDLSRLDRVVEVEPLSRSARIQAGAFGPALEAQLRPHDLTLRHYPQSFEHSTLGGWIATRAGGHFATGRTHIDDFVAAVRAVTPAGVVESRRLPGSGAGPSPDRLWLGSEGALGVITEAWLRVQPRPRHRASATVRFADLAAGVAATRAVAQSALWPASCRLLDPGEAAGMAGVQDGSAVLLLGFESPAHPVDGLLDAALTCCADHGGRLEDAAPADRSSDDTAEAWRSSFFAMPYLRDAMVRLGCVAETFETACPWDRFDEVHAGILEAVGRALDDVCGGGRVTCRFTHVYPDGPAPYYTVIAPGDPAALVRQWDEVKAAAAEVITAHGATITHHHAVGRDHRPWYDRQRPAPFGQALAAVKRTLDPAGILNPGVLVG